MHKSILAISTFFLSVSAFGMAEMASTTFIVNVGDAMTGSAAENTHLTGDSLALEMAHSYCLSVASTSTASTTTKEVQHSDHAGGAQAVAAHTNGDKHIVGDALCANEANSLNILSGQGRQGDYVCQCM